MELIKSRQIPLVICGVCGGIVIADYFVNVPGLRLVASEVTGWVLGLAAYALMLGVINIVLRSYRSVARRTTGVWYFDAWSLLIMCAFVVVGLAEGVGGAHISWMYNNISLPIESTLFALTGFYYGSACYRAMRVRNWEATVLIVCALFVIMSNAPIGAAVSSVFPTIGGWIMTVVNLSGNRAFIMGAAVGAAVTGVRVLLGRERLILR
jgi:hypothetical protein